MYPPTQIWHGAAAASYAAIDCSAEVGYISMGCLLCSQWSIHDVSAVFLRTPGSAFCLVLWDAIIDQFV
ncbi:hypothetical protein L1987_35292 [Smallanthus sonchifolius]|uniref:Uncharacterized protein n=1 Tax=Smallanthus sonchifolius TaxID=185202 RepID=A0ACB9HWY0_9ASTR|nr:hypothetical protein L1987_35292 [Smallanthus sonchifolius]